MSNIITFKLCKLQVISEPLPVRERGRLILSWDVELNL